MHNLIQKVKQHYYSSKGVKIPSKIIVFESDDWGSIRMQSSKGFSVLDGKYSIGKSHYNRFDSLEQSQDLEALYDVLRAHKNNKGKSPIITANFNVANPDFSKIKANKFGTYYYEDFLNSYKNYNNQENTFKVVEEGMNEHLFYPQYHGREHVQVDYWMRDLFQGNEATLKGFEYGFFGFSKNQINEKGYLTAFDIETENDLNAVQSRIQDGYKIFERIFGFTSKSIIPPQNTIHPLLLPTLKQLNIEYLQGARVNRQGEFLKNPAKNEKRFTGSKTSQGIINLVRNVTFEPSYGKIDWVSKSLKEIEVAFKWNKPAVICSHRVNFIGRLSEKNRKTNLKELDKLFSEILKRWPEVQFLHSSQLGELIKNKEG